MSERARVVAVVQARMGSSRLPGKVLWPLGGRPVLDWVLRAAAAAQLDEVVVATSVEPEDDAIEAFCAQRGVRVVRGPEEDVLTRYRMAADASGADAVVRLTSDCPLLDPALIDRVVELWRTTPGLGYAATTLHRTLPRGLDVELVSAGALRLADAEARGHHRVHVTSWLYRPGSSVPRMGVTIGPDASGFRVTLDEADDAVALDRIVADLGDRVVPFRELVAHLEAHPAIVALNAAIEQKALESG